MTTLLSFAVVILVLVFFHELGHFIFARLFGMRVEVFSVGMGPEIISRTDKHGTIWRLAIIPIGGYVKVLEGDKNRNVSGSFESKPVWQRMIMVFAGPVFSVLLGWIIFLSTSIIWGKAVVPDYNKVGINQVVADSPAQLSGLKTNDIITNITLNNTKYPINSFYDMYQVIQRAGIKTITMDVMRNGNELKINITPNAYNTQKGDIVYRIGVTAHKLSYENVSFYESFITANKVSIKALLMVYNGVIEMFKSGIDKENVGGPIKIAQMSGKTANMGAIYFLHFMALLSINLGVLNMIPLPILDGGRLVLLGAEAIIRRPLPDKFIQPIMAFSVLFMLVLFVFIIMLDLGLL